MSAGSRDIREDIIRYVPGINGQNSHHGIDCLSILLFGFAGHGKSSLINSCMCVVKGEPYRNIAGAGKDKGGRTIKRKTYNLTNTILITDNRGFQAMKPGEILEVCAQLRHLRFIGDVDWKKDNLEETVRVIPEINKRPKDFNLPVIVHSCLHNFKEEESMTKLIKYCHDITGIHPIVVLTNIGPPNERQGNGAEIERRFGEMGCGHRIRLENYTENSYTRTPDADQQFLNFLDVCMKEAEYVIGQMGRPDALDVFAKHVANQVKEENAVNVQEMRTKLEEQINKVRELEERLRREEEKKWYERCSIM